MDGSSAPINMVWLTMIQCARYDGEQNLEIYQKESQLFYRAIKVSSPCTIEFLISLLVETKFYSFS